MDKETFRKLCHGIVESWIDNDIDRIIDKVWEHGAKALRLEEEPDNNLAVYPFMGAFFERCAQAAIYGCINRQQASRNRRKTNRIKAYM